jgi:hypothetical protein
MVFHNQFTSPDGSDRHGGEQTLGQADLFEELQVDLPARPAHIAAVAICARVHTGTFVDVAGLHVRLEGDTNLVFAVPRCPLSELSCSSRSITDLEHGRSAPSGRATTTGLPARNFGVSIT